MCRTTLHCTFLSLPMHIPAREVCLEVFLFVCFLKITKDYIDTRLSTNFFFYVQESKLWGGKILINKLFKHFSSNIGNLKKNMLKTHLF